jgi:phage terminase Nu1 subunit (DNA packaging protein)
MVDPNWKPDPAKVQALIAEHKAEAAAQELLVEKLRDLLDAEERELWRRKDRVTELRQAWAKYGVEIPA